MRTWTAARLWCAPVCGDMAVDILVDSARPAGATRGRSGLWVPREADRRAAARESRPSVGTGRFFSEPSWWRTVRTRGTARFRSATRTPRSPARRCRPDGQRPSLDLFREPVRHRVASRFPVPVRWNPATSSPRVRNRDRDAAYPMATCRLRPRSVSWMALESCRDVRMPSDLGKWGCRRLPYPHRRASV